ncbi:hypothetical protein BGZ83_001821 [Gryganskiella cystojenkinii]|nr:hypothetical protein BGZ83_001821 [Gryganskiella cystojenkinii]
MLVTVLALTLCLSTVALFPVDIYLVSKIMDPSTGQRRSWATEEAIEQMQLSVRIVYYGAYGLIASFCFVWIPLAYFYFEELADEGQTISQRLWAAIKYTVYFILVAAILLLTGLLIQPAIDGGRRRGTFPPVYPQPPIENDLKGETILFATLGIMNGARGDPNAVEQDDWEHSLLSRLDVTAALGFAAGIMALVGMGVLIFYTAPGLSLLPLHLLAGLKSIPASLNEMHAALALNRERQIAILNRYPRQVLPHHQQHHQQEQHQPHYNHYHATGTGGAAYVGIYRQLTDQDREAMSELAQEEVLLENKARIVQRARDSWFNQCQWIIRPFQIVFGLTGAILTVLLIESIAVTSIGQLENHICGAPLCGYFPSRPDLPNFLNTAFLRLSMYFPLDYTLMVMLILYMFWATTKGVISLGIRFLWINLYKFKVSATQPQGLLAATMLLMFSLAGLCYSLTVFVAPDYSMFGSQKYCNHTVISELSLSDTLSPYSSSLEMSTLTRDCSQHPERIIPCHLDGPQDLCTLTVTAQMILQMMAVNPALGAGPLQAVIQGLFTISFLLALVFNLFRGCRRGFGQDPLEEDDDDDEDDGEDYFEDEELGTPGDELDTLQRQRRRQLHHRQQQRQLRGGGETPGRGGGDGGQRLQLRDDTERRRLLGSPNHRRPSDPASAVAVEGGYGQPVPMPQPPQSRYGAVRRLG